MNLESLAIIVIGLGLGGFVKGIAGIGLPLFGIPFIAAFLGLPHAVAVMTMPIIVTNAWQAVQFWNWERMRDFVPVLLAAGAVGTVIGTWMLATFPAEMLSIVLGVLLIAYIALSLTRPTFRLERSLAPRVAPAAGFFGGILQGAAGISAPVTVTFAHSLRLERGDYLFAISALFFVTTVVQLVALSYAGIMTGTRFMESCIALAPVAAMMPVGNWVARYLSRKAFDRVILAVLAMIAAKLIYDALTR